MVCFFAKSQEISGANKFILPKQSLQCHRDIQEIDDVRCLLACYVKEWNEEEEAQRIQFKSQEINRLNII